MKTTRIRSAGLALAVGLGALGGCGGDAGDADGAVDARQTSLRIQPTLLDDEGRPQLSDPSLRPPQPALRTQAERYASRQQAQALLAAVGSAALPVAVGCCGDDAVDAAVENAAQGLQAGPDRTALLVSGDELARAVAAADRLEALAAGRVWLVTP